MGAGVSMSAPQTPRYKDGVALTEQCGTWYVVTSVDAVAYLSYEDALEDWVLTPADSH